MWRHDRGRSTRDGPPLLQLQASPAHHSLVSSSGLWSGAGALLDPVSQRASSGCCCCGRDDTGSVLVRCRVTQVTIAAAAGLALAEAREMSWSWRWCHMIPPVASGQWMEGYVCCLQLGQPPCRAAIPSHPITRYQHSPVSTLQHLHSSLLSTPPQHSPMHTTLKLYFVLVCLLWTCGSVI